MIREGLSGGSWVVRRESWHFWSRKIAKHLALQGIEMNSGMLREGKEVSIAGTEKAEKKVVHKVGEVSQVMGKLPRLSETQFPHL